MFSELSVRIVQFVFFDFTLEYLSFQIIYSW